MQPTLFSNFVEYAGGFGGNIFNMFDSQKEAIEGQKQQDISMATIIRKPQNHPSKIANK